MRLMNVVSLILTSLLFGTFLQAQSTKPRIAIKTFENPANYNNSTIGNGLTDILTTELSKTGKFRLVEREAVDELMKDINFGKSEWAKGSTFAVKGQFSGAEYFLFGKVTNFSYSEQAFQTTRADYSGTHQVTAYNQSADVRVDFRVASTKTGEIILSESGAAHNQNQSYSSEMAIWFQCLRSNSFVTAEFPKSLIGRSTMDAIRDVAHKLNDLASELPSYTGSDALDSSLEGLEQAEGKILAAVSTREFVVTLGSRTGLKKGDELTVYKESLTKNKKGEVIYQERKEIASLEVIDVSATGDRSKTMLKGAVKSTEPGMIPQEGNIVRINMGTARAIRRSNNLTAPKASGNEQPREPQDNSAQLKTIMRKADRYLEDGYYAQALEQFQKADEVSPNNSTILDGLASAHLLLKDFLEAEETAEKMLELGFPVDVPAGHVHSMGSCRGKIRIERGRLSFSSAKGDHNFALSNQEVHSYPDGKCGYSGLFCLQIVFRTSDGKEKKFNFLPLVFIRLDGAHVTGGEKAVVDTLKLNNLIDRLIKKYVIGSQP